MVQFRFNLESLSKYCGYLHTQGVFSQQKHRYAKIRDVKPVITTLRAFLLAWSLLLTTQLALVHGYTHQQQAQQAGGASRAAGDVDKATHEQLCNLCLTLSQLGTALPSQHHVLLASFAAPDFLAGLADGVAGGPVAAQPARGPPVQG